MYYHDFLYVAPSVISFSSSHKDYDTVSTDTIVLTCRISGQLLQWTYEQNGVNTRIVANHSTQNDLCENKTQYSGDDLGVVIHSLLAANNVSTGDITSILEVTLEMKFSNIIIGCRAIEGEEMVNRTIIFNGKP